MGVARGTAHVVPGRAWADAKELAKLNHQALEQYDLLEFDAAKRTLEQALNALTTLA